MQEKIEVDQSLLEATRNPELQEPYIRDAFITMAICNTVLVSRNSHCRKTVKENDSLIPGILRRVLGRQGSLMSKLRFFDSSNEESEGVDTESVDREHCGACEGSDDVRYEAESPDDLALVEVGTLLLI